VALDTCSNLRAEGALIFVTAEKVGGIGVDREVVKRVGILIVAYNAASTLAGVLDRIPAAVRASVDEILVFDDCSRDSTYLVGLGYKHLAQDLPLTVIRHPSNLGYGGNQKAGYRWAIEHGLDLVVLLHGDGQYAPECLDRLLSPLKDGQSDAVFGSRMLEPGAARQGGMPRYKHIGNRILTRVQNKVAGLTLSEWHSGYRAYSVAALKAIPFEDNSDGFDFDTQIIIQLHEAGKRIAEVPIPTYYGDEICYVNGMGYARDVVRHVARYRAHKMGFGSGETAFASAAYEVKSSEDSSHATILSWMASRPPSRVLDVGCSSGGLAKELRNLGHHVVGVDSQEFPGVADAVDRFVACDLEMGLPADVGDGFDVVIAGDVLEHLRRPELLLADLRGRLAPGGSAIVSIPNFAHWYPRTLTALGRFDYDRRGILDAGHLRFFTRRSFERLVGRAKFSVHRCKAVGIPFEVTKRGGIDGEGGRSISSALTRVNQACVAVRPNLFAYQYVFELTPVASRPDRYGTDSASEVIDLGDWTLGQDRPDRRSNELQIGVSTES
jgi:glycosyltransferase involved in cell wall biosynthesis